MEANITVKGMHCPSCEALIVDVLTDEGVESAKVSFKEGTAKVKFDEDKITLERIKDLIKKEGYDLEN